MRLLLLLASCALAFGQDDDRSGNKLPYRPFNVQPVVPDERAEALIDKLVELARPRGGLRDDAGGGTYFALSDDPFGRLVRMGPAALPALLKHLGDARKTRLAFTPHASGMGGVFRYDEMQVPPTRTEERKRIRAAVGDGVATDGWVGRDIDKEPIEGHTVTVGDCCFAILGQIVNRPYEAVRYQPTLITAISSPTLEPRLAKAARAAWGYDDPGQVLARSLQEDFHSRAGGSLLQAGAAARLCVYFPKQGGDLVARRIAGLGFDPAKDGMVASHLLDSVLGTGHPAVYRAWLRVLDPARPRPVLLGALEAIHTPPAPEVMQRIRTVFQGTDDVAVMLACLEWLPSKGDTPFGRRARQRIRKIFEQTDEVAVMVACLNWLPLDGEGLFERLERARQQNEGLGEKGCTNRRKLIEAMIRVDPKRALAVCRAYINGGHVPKRIVLGALYQARDRDLALALLPALLEETALFGWWPTLPDSVARLQPRVCDVAAAALARAVKGLRFTNAKKVADRDLEIARMKRALAAR